MAEGASSSAIARDIGEVSIEVDESPRETARRPSLARLADLARGTHKKQFILN
jgi:hypothetical protein